MISFMTASHGMIGCLEDCECFHENSRTAATDLQVMDDERHFDSGPVEDALAEVVGGYHDQKYGGPDWVNGLPLDTLAVVAAGRDDLKSMRGACKIWKAGFDQSVTKIKLKHTPTLSNPFVSGDMLTPDGPFSAVRTLDFSEGIFLPELPGNVCLERLLGAQITTLILKMPVLTDAGIAHLQHLPLTSLDLQGCERVTDAGLEFLVGKPLTELNLGACDLLTPAGVARFLRGLPLRRLTMPPFRKDPAGLPPETLAPLAAMPLTDLSLACPGLTDPALEHLRGRPLSRLDLGCGPLITNAGLACLAGMPLQALRYTSATPAGAGLAALHGAPLASLVLETPLTNAGISHLHGLPLTRLVFWSADNEDDGITDDGLAALSGMPLTSLSLCSADLVTDRGLAVLEGSTSLTDLHLGWLPNITGEGLRALQGASVSVLRLHTCERLAEEGIPAGQKSATSNNVVFRVHRPTWQNAL